MPPLQFTPACQAPAVAGDVVGTAAGSAVDGVFDTFASKVTEGFAEAAQLVVAWWIEIDTPGVQTSGPVAELRQNVWWVTGAVTLLSVMLGAGKMALTRNSRPAVETTRGLLLVILTGAAGVPTVALLTEFGDAYAGWVLERSADGDVGARLAVLTMIGRQSGVGPAVLLLLGILGILASLAQVGLMLVRVAVLTVLAGVLPLAAAAAGTQTGLDWLKRMLAWLLAFVLYKPAAAMIYAGAFVLVGDGQDATAVLSGFFLMILAIVALPALLRLLAPAVGAAVAAGSGSGAGLAAAGMVLTTGARGYGGGSPPSPPRISPPPQPGTSPAAPTAVGAAARAGTATTGGAATAGAAILTAATTAATAARTAAGSVGDGRTQR